jgi:hypothetical protein
MWDPENPVDVDLREAGALEKEEEQATWIMIINHPCTFKSLRYAQVACKSHNI